MSIAKFLRGFPIVAGCGILLVVSSGMAVAQGAPAGAPAAGFRMPSLPKRGFENTGQDPAKYSPEEKAAVAVVEKWIETIHSRDVDGHMALIDDNIVFRGDPLEPLVRGAAYYCSQIVGFGGTPSNTSESFVVSELYVVGGKWDTQVLLRRVDINGPAGTIGYLGGYPVPVAVHLRIRNGKVVEWYDAPTNKISIGALPFKIQTGGPRNIAESCKKFSNGSGGVARPTQALPYGYGTTKAEYFFNVEEASAAQTVRSWFAAWMSGDPLLLAAFVDQNVIFRSNPADELAKGRDNLLKLVCGSLGEKRKLLDLFVIGGDYDSSVITRWEATNAQGNVTHMGSFFRVQKGLVVEWYDTPNDPVGAEATKVLGRNATAAPAAARNVAACQAVDAAFGQPASQ